MAEKPLNPPPALDLCVMNPPFTRSVGGNLLFGSAPAKEREQMQKELKKLVGRPGVLANITAGLGSVFVALSDLYIKPGGRVALVLPKALLSGVAWRRTRELFSRNYRVEYLVASQDPLRWNFSESTDLSETLLVATKLDANAPRQTDDPVVALNLWRNPATAFEALAISHELMRATPPDVENGQGALEIALGKEKVGEAVAFPWVYLKDKPTWLLPCAFAQSDLIRASHHLLQQHLWLPGSGKVGTLPLCPLSQLGSLGPDVRDIHDGFGTSHTPTPYPAFWGHDAGAVTTLAQVPNQYLSPLPQAKPGRHLRKVEDLWPLAGRIAMAERLWLKTQRAVAVRLSERVLANVWWPLSLKQTAAGEEGDKVLVLWLNSTLGLILLFVHREETRGAWVKFKKPVLAAMPVLDLGALSSGQTASLASAYDRLSGQELLPLPQMHTDAVRAEIDRSIAAALGLPDFSVLRTMLAREPVVCLQRL